MSVEPSVLEQRLELAESLFDHLKRCGSLLDGFSHFPIQTLGLIRQHDAGLARLRIDDDLWGGRVTRCEISGAHAS